MTSIQSGHRYVIRNKKSNNSCVDLDNGTKRKIHCWAYHGGTNQQWDFTQQSDNSWHIKNVAFGKYLAFDGNAQDGQPIIGRDHPYSWHIWEAKNDKTAYKICAPNTTHNLDLTDHGNPANGTLVQLWTQWDGENQYWRVSAGKFY